MTFPADYKERGYTHAIPCILSDMLLENYQITQDFDDLCKYVDFMKMVSRDGYFIGIKQEVRG